MPLSLAPRVTIRAGHEESVGTTGFATRMEAGMRPVVTLWVGEVARLGPFWLRIAALCLGGSLGTLARYGATVALNHRLGTAFPWATAIINVSGSFVIGLLAGLLATWHPASTPRLLLLVGFLGAYTTFSTFSLDAVTLGRDHQIIPMLAYQFGSVILGFLATVLGLALSGAIGSGTR